MTATGSRSVPKDGAGRARVFISYSRKDAARADEVRDYLVRRGFDAYLDKHDILPGEPWQDRLAQLIAGADAVVFLLSPQSVASRVCDWEVNEAERRQKRLLPVVIENVEADKVPGRLKRLNYIFLRPTDDERAGGDALDLAILIDIDWVREHTRISDLACRWAGAGRLVHMLLSRKNVGDAEAWRDRRSETSPALDAQQLDFVAQSRQRITRSTRRWLVTSLVGTLTFAAVAVAAVLQRIEAGRQRDTALIGQSRFLADLADQRRARGDALTGALLALEALPDAKSSRERPYEQRAEASLYAAYLDIRERAVLKIPERYPIQQAAFTPDGARVVALALDGRIHVRSASGTVDSYRAAEDEQFTHMWVGAGGLVLAAIYDKGLVEIDLDAKTQRVLLVQLVPTIDMQKIVSIRADGNRFAVLSRPEVIISFSRNGLKAPAIYRVPADAQVVTHLGDRLVTAHFGRDRTVTLHDVEASSTISVLSGHDDVINDVMFSADWTRVVTSAGHTDRALLKDATARVWDVATGAEVAKLVGHRLAVMSAVFAPDGKQVLTQAGDGVRLWDILKGREVGQFGEEDAITAVLSPDGNRLLTAARDGARLRYLNGPIDRLFDGHSEALRGAAYSPDGATIATWAEDGMLLLWSRERSIGEIARPYGPGRVFPAVMVSDMRFADAGRRLYVATRTGIDHVDLASGRVKATLPLSGFPFQLGVSPSEPQVAIVDEAGQMRVWDGTAADADVAFQLPRGDAVPLATSAAGRFAARQTSVGLELWSLEDRKRVAKFDVTERVLAAAVSSDRRHFVTAGFDGSVRLWDVATERQKRTFIEKRVPFNSVTFSDDGSLVAAGGGANPLAVWSVSSGLDRIHFKDAAKMSVAAFDASGHRIVFAIEGRRTAISSVDDGRRIHVFDPMLPNRGLDVQLIAIAGDVIAIADQSGNVQVSRVFPSLQSLVDATKAYVPRCLTVDQRKRAFLTDGPPGWCAGKQ